jgi:hypothetical protein
MTNDFAAVSTLVAEFQRKLEVIIKRDGSRHLMDAHIPLDVVNLIEDELMPILDAVIAWIEWEPSDEDLCPGEPPVTMQEMHSAAHAQHMELHK